MMLGFAGSRVFWTLPCRTISLTLSLLLFTRPFERSWRHVLTLDWIVSASLAAFWTVGGLCVESEMERRMCGGTK